MTRPAVGEGGRAAPGWRVVSVIDQKLAAPPRFIRHWIVDQLIGIHDPELAIRFQAVVVRTGMGATETIVNPRSSLVRRSVWDLSGKDDFTVYRQLLTLQGKVLVETRESYGVASEGSGSILHLTAAVRPVSFLARLAFGVSRNSLKQLELDHGRLPERIEEDYRRQAPSSAN